MFKKIQIAIAAVIVSGFIGAQTIQAGSYDRFIAPTNYSQAQRTSSWYEAHGYFWNGQEYAYEYQGQQPRFQDRDTIATVLNETGIDFQNGDKAWSMDEMITVTTSVVKLMHQVGNLEGGARLNQLLGNSPIHFVRRSHSAQYPGATAERNTDKIWFHDEMFSADRSGVEMFGTVAHELAHIIGDVNKTADGRTLKEAFPYLPDGLGLVSPDTATAAGHPEYFAEGVKLWVFPSYPTSWPLDDELQGSWLAQMLSK